MLKVVLNTNRLLISSVKNNDYNDILRFYKDKQNYFFATGEKDILDSYSFHNKIISKNVDNYFFCTAKLSELHKNIGCISGFVDTDKNLLWIYILIVDVIYQRRGYGTEIFRSVMNYLSEQFTINIVLIGVANENVNGKNFWEKQGFKLLNRQNVAKPYKIYMFR